MGEDRATEEGRARDHAASQRDVDAGVRDLMADEDMPDAERSARRDAARDRMDAMRDRQAAARDREAAARDREAAARDREAAAHDREEAARREAADPPDAAA
jgi:uncharacterized membrane protein YukC